MIRAAFLLAVSCALAACSPGGSPDDAAARAVAPKAPVARQKTVFDTQLKALDKARGVQKIIDEDKAHTDQAIKDAGG